MSRPGDSSRCPAPRIGVLLINLGTPDAPEPRGGAALPRRIPQRPARHRDPAESRGSRSCTASSCAPAREKSAHAYKQDMDRTRARRSPRSPAARPMRCQQRFGTEVIVDHAMRYGNPGIAGPRRPADGRQGCDADPRCAALSAILRGDDGDRQRRASSRRSPRCAGSRRCARCRLIMTIRSTSTRCKANLERQLAALDFEPERLLLSFHGMPQRTLAARRSLSLPLPEDRAAARRGAWAAGRRRLPVALRPRQMAGAGDRRGARRLSGARRHANRRRRARLFRRLPRNTGGARHPRPRDVPRRRRNAFRAARLPQRQRRRHGHARTR